nr:hypothetical protein [Citrobacter amalonaticus]
MTESGCADRLKAIISEPVFNLERQGWNRSLSPTAHG